jgi:hypothetical protein
MSAYNDDESRAQIERLSALPLGQLAAEIIAMMLTVVGNGDRGRVSVHDIALKAVPGIARLPQEEIWGLDELLGEGIQALEQEGLAQCTVVGTDRRLQWVLTRRGRATPPHAPTSPA